MVMNGQDHPTQGNSALKLWWGPLNEQLNSYQCNVISVGMIKVWGERTEMGRKRVKGQCPCLHWQQKDFSANLLTSHFPHLLLKIFSSPSKSTENKKFSVESKVGKLVIELDSFNEKSSLG